jgi:hypothetical protein
MNSLERLMASDDDGDGDGDGDGGDEKRGTVSVGVGVSGTAAGVTSEASLAVITDDCDAGLLFSYGSGFTSDLTIGANGGVFASASNAPTIQTVTGKGSAGGFTAGATYAGTVEVFHGPHGGGSSSIYTGATIMGGAGVKVPAGYAILTNTIMITTWSQISAAFRTGVDRWVGDAERTIRSIEGLR